MIKIEGFSIKEKIYQSENSIIYSAVREFDKCFVAIKTLPTEYPSLERIARFNFEYNICKNLNLPDVIKLYSIEKYNNSKMIVMEFFEGKSIKDSNLMGKLELDEFLKLSIKIINTLEQIHDKNVIHKDINPSNILWNPTNYSIRIIDFGIATLLSNETQEVVNPKGLEGSISYISPEQTGRMNRKIDYRSDYYSLGATFYEILTGHKPFESNDAMELVHFHIAKMPKAPNTINKNIPQILSDIILKLMAKNAEDRYQSSFGIKYDLERCLESLINNNKVEDFKIGEKDISKRFEIPQKLYGREDEVNTLLKEFDSVCKNGKSKVVFVTGYSGIGKSSLVNEIHKPVVAKRGRFISGKFDQLLRNIPYYPFIQAFQSMVKQILLEDEKEIIVWKGRILDALGSTGQVIIDVIPQLEAIIGKQPGLPDLSPQQSYNRFNMSFKKFATVLATRENPLIIFIDDLQWADSATLKLIEIFMTDPNINYILFIGSYRENEVDSSHPLMFTIDEINKCSQKINTINLMPMKLIDIASLLSDTLGSVEAEVVTLAELCMKKTNGNPFFINQFLKSMHEENLIVFISTIGKWDWDIKKIEDQNYADNIVDLMIDKIQQLSQNTQEILKVAACCGNMFNLKDLCIILEKSPVEIANNLYYALKEEIVLPLNNNYKLISEGAENLNSCYKFSHDKIQQAAYSQIEENLKSQMHLRIGRLLLKDRSEDILENNIFDIVNHLNIGISLIKNEDEKIRLIALNLTAGKKAKKSSAYGDSFNYFNIALKLLENDCWVKRYDVVLDVYVETAEAAYLFGKYDVMDKMIEEILKNSVNILDKIKAYEVKMRSFIAQNKRSETVKLGIEVINFLGVKTPAKATKKDIIISLLKFELLILGKSNQDIINIKLETNELRYAIMDIMDNVLSSAFHTTPNVFLVLCLEVAYRSVKYGISKYSFFGFVAYAIVLFKLGRLEAGLNASNLFRSLWEKMPIIDMKCKALFCYAYFLAHYTKSINETISIFKESYLAGIETGDTEFAALAMGQCTRNNYFKGLELIKCEKEIINVSLTLKKLNQKLALYYNKMFHQIVSNLLGRSNTPSILEGEQVPSENELVSLGLRTNNRLLLCLFYTLKMQLNFLFYEYADAVKNTKLCKEYMNAQISTIQVPYFLFYESLVYLEAYKNASKSERKKILKIVNANRKELKERNKYVPMTLQNKCYLIEAEYSKILGRYIEAGEYYNKAIDASAKNEFIHEEALSSERAAIFYYARGNDRVALSYLTHARFCYERWGAVAKIIHLDKVYPELQNNIKKSISMSHTNNITSTLMVTSMQNGDALDLTSIIKASQAISEEIVYKNLIEKLLKVVAENGGAQKIILLSVKDKTFELEAEYNSDNNEVKLGQVYKLEKDEGKILFPESVINYVLRTNESIILDNVHSKNEFENDVYIKDSNLKSILCMPLIYQGKLKEILYLENRLSTGAFTQQRLQILNMLSSQMVISIENSKMYTNLEEVVQQRTKELNIEIEQRKKAQKLMEEMATHDTLTGLPNRRLFLDILSHRITFAMRHKLMIGLLFIDLDGFKKVNDTLGHASGDIVLKIVSERLGICVRETDTISRLGGDEFTVILDRVDDIKNIEQVCNRIIEEIGKLIPLGENMGHVTPSIGISIFPDDATNIDTLVANADNAMYTAKNSGKNKYIFFESRKLDS